MNLLILFLPFVFLYQVFSIALREISCDKMRTLPRITNGSMFRICQTAKIGWEVTFSKSERMRVVDSLLPFPLASWAKNGSGVPSIKLVCQRGNNSQCGMGVPVVQTKGGGGWQTGDEGHKKKLQSWGGCLDFDMGPYHIERPHGGRGERVGPKSDL